MVKRGASLAVVCIKVGSHLHGRGVNAMVCCILTSSVFAAISLGDTRMQMINEPRTACSSRPVSQDTRPRRRGYAECMQTAFSVEQCDLLGLMPESQSDNF